MRLPVHAGIVAGWWPRRIAIAGGFGLAILLALILVPQLLSESYQTDSSGQLTVVLPDSSTVTLCENSSFSIRRGFFGGPATMNLEGGGYFSVRPQETPFIVTTSIGSVRVVGTQFDVRCDSKELYVAVSRGTVAVSSGSSRADSTVFVHRGEFVSCLKGGEPAAPKKSLAGDGPMWLSGVLTFDHADLHAVCDEIGRQLGVSIVLEHTPLDTVRITGLIRGRDTRQILSALCNLTGTTYRVVKGSYVVY
ncbi:MAG TPA: FecR domain-containing protein [Bacteroidota bacterium]|nr:FecR domain-containing protein [Bacteroidota bacterium]